MNEYTDSLFEAISVQDPMRVAGLDKASFAEKLQDPMYANVVLSVIQANEELAPEFGGISEQDFFTQIGAPAPGVVAEEEQVYEIPTKEEIIEQIVDDPESVTETFKLPVTNIPDFYREIELPTIKASDQQAYLASDEFREDQERLTIEIRQESISLNNELKEIEDQGKQLARLQETGELTQEQVDEYNNRIDAFRRSQSDFEALQERLSNLNKARVISAEAQGDPFSAFTVSLAKGVDKIGEFLKESAIQSTPNILLFPDTGPKEDVGFGDVRFGDDRVRRNLNKNVAVEALEMMGNLGKSISNPELAEKFKDVPQYNEWFKDQDIEAISKEYEGVKLRGYLLNLDQKLYAAYLEDAFAGISDEDLSDLEDHLREVNLYKGLKGRARDAELKRQKAAIRQDIGDRIGLASGFRDVLDVTPEYYDDLQSTFVGGAVLGLGETLPALVMPGGAVVRTGAIASQQVTSLMNEMEDNPNFADVSESEKLMVATPIAITTAVLDRLGFDSAIGKSTIINRITKSALAKLGPKSGAKAFSKIVENEIRSAAANGAIRFGRAGLSEGLTGGAQTAIELGGKDLYNDVVKGKEFFEGPEAFSRQYFVEVLKGAGQEAIGGGIIGAPIALAKASSTDAIQNMPDYVFDLALEAVSPSKIAATRAEIKRSLANRVRKGEITKQQAEAFLEDFNDFADFTNDIGKLDVKSKKKAYRLFSEQRKLKAEIAAAKNKNLVAPQQNRLRQIDQELQKIATDAFQKQEARDIPDAERAEGVQEVEEEVREQVKKPTQEEEAFIDTPDKIYHSTTTSSALEQGALKKPSESDAPRIEKQDDDAVFFTEKNDWDGRGSTSAKLVFNRNKIKPSLRKGKNYESEKELLSDENVKLSKEEGLLGIELYTSPESYDSVTVSVDFSNEAEKAGINEGDYVRKIMEENHEKDFEETKQRAQKYADKYQVPVKILPPIGIDGRTEIVNPKTTDTEAPVEFSDKVKTALADIRKAIGKAQATAKAKGTPARLKESLRASIKQLKADRDKAVSLINKLKDTTDPAQQQALQSKINNVLGIRTEGAIPPTRKQQVSKEISKEVSGMELGQQRREQGFLGRKISNYTAALNMHIKNLFGSEAGRKLLRSIGFNEFNDGINRAELKWMAATEGFRRKFGKKKLADGSKFNSKDNTIERGILGFLRRTPEAESERNPEFKRRLNLMLENAKAARELGKAKLADAIDRVVGRLDLKALEGKTYEEAVAILESKVDPIQLEAVQFWNDTWADDFESTEQVALDFYDNKIKREGNFVTDVYQMADGETEYEQGDRSNLNIYTGEAATLKEILPPTTLFKDGVATKFINLDFDANQGKRYRQTAKNVETARALFKVEKAIRSRKFKDAFTNPEDQKIIAERLKTYLNRERLGAPEVESESEKRFYDSLGKVLNPIAKAGAVYGLSGVSQPIAQVIPMVGGAAIKAGPSNLTKSLVDYMNQRNAFKDFLRRTDQSINFRGIQSDTAFDAIADKTGELIAEGMPPKRALIKALKLLDKAGDVSLQAYIGAADALAAEISFGAYYLQGLQRQGLSTDIKNWAEHNVNKEAAEYAQDMVDEQQAQTKRNLQGELFASKKPLVRAVTRAALPFATHTMNMKHRLVNSAQTLASKKASNLEKQDAARDILAVTAESAMFHAIKQGLGFGLNEIFDAILSGLDREERTPKEQEAIDKKKQEERRKTMMRNLSRGYTSVLRDLTPVPALEFPMVKQIFDYGIKLAGKQLPPLYTDSQGNEVSALYVYDGPPSEVGGVNIDALGVYGVAIDNLVSGVQKIRGGLTGELTKEYFGEKSTAEIPQEYREAMLYAGIAEAFGPLLGLPSQDVSRFSRALEKEARIRQTEIKRPITDPKKIFEKDLSRRARKGGRTKREQLELEAKDAGMTPKKYSQSEIKRIGRGMN